MWFGLVLWHIAHCWLFNNNTIQFSISTQFSSIRPIDRTISGATTPGQTGFGGDGIEGVHCISLSSSITEASPSDCLVSYLGHSLEESCSSAEMQSVYSAAPADWAIHYTRGSPWGITPKVLYCGLEVSFKSCRAITPTFEHILLGKA